MSEAVATIELAPSLIRDPLVIEIVETGWQPWLDVFSVYHYLHGKGPMPFSTAFTGFDAASGDPVAFMGMSGLTVGPTHYRAARACRMVVHQEWQGAGIGLRFLNLICEREAKGEGFIGAPVPTYMHTAHPALCAGLRRDKHWQQISSRVIGDVVGGPKKSVAKGLRYGGHTRSVAGFRYGSLKTP